MSNTEEKSSAQWAIDLLTPNPDYQQSVATIYYNEFWCTIGGIAAPAFRNYMIKRPPFTGIHQHIIGGLLGLGVGIWLSRKDEYECGRRDAILIDYIRLHPDRFPEPERKKFADVLQPWVPVR